jgi:C4-dicarboxylate-specific signal transduction histidine kinase
LQQVLLNVILNGCDAMADTEASRRRLSVHTGRNNGMDVLISIADQGHGIPPEHLERVFESFFTTKSDGLGLGLAVCRTIISAHGGKLWATNNPERGASLHISLPGAPRRAGAT